MIRRKQIRKHPVGRKPGKVAGKGRTSQKTCHRPFLYSASGKGADKTIFMPYFLDKKELLLCLALLYSVSTAKAQENDTLLIRSLSGVEVTEKARAAITRASAPVQQMNRADIDRLGLQNLSEVVGRFAGVTLHDYGGIGGLKTVSIRSLGSQHTAVSYDGIALVDAQRGQVDISSFSLDNVENVALAIGHADDIFQSARMYAAASALSIRTSEPAFTDRHFRLHAKLKGGSFGLFNPAIRYNRKVNQHLALSGYASWLSAKGDYPFTLTNGQIVTKEIRKNSDIQSLHTEINLFGHFSEGKRLQAKLYYYDSERGLPGSVVLYANRTKERLWDKNGFAQWQYGMPLGKKFELQTQAKYSRTLSLYHNRDDQYASGVMIDQNTQQEYYGSASVRFTPATAWSAVYSSDLSHVALESNVVEQLSPRRLTTFNVLAVRFRNTRATVTAALLHTFMTDRVKQGKQPTDKQRLSPTVGLSFRPWADHTLRLRMSYKDVFRVPTFADLYYLRMGNTNLVPERATQLNAGLTWSGQTPVMRYMTLSIDGYYNRVADKIVAIPTMYIFKMMNVGKVRIAGVDANLSAECPLGSEAYLRFSATYAFQHAVDVTNAESKNYRHQIPYTPRHSGAVTATLENRWANIGYILTVTGERYVLPQNIASNRTGGYAEHTFSAHKTFAFRTTDIRIQGEIINAANKTYDVIRYYPMPGRAFRLSIFLNY